MERQMTKLELEQCINEYGKDIYSFCRHLACSRQEADDLYQETFLKAVEQLEKLNQGSSMKSYLLGIAVRIWKNKKRKYAWRNRIAPVEQLVEERDGDVTAGAEVSTEDSFIAKEEIRAVQSAVGKLPEKMRYCVLLYYMEGLSTTQIAAVLKIPEGTVKSRLYQARKHMEKELERMFYGTQL